MGEDSTAALRRFREEHAQVFAMLWRRLGEYDLVDASLADAYLAATASWPGGIPHNPATWMATVALSATTGVVSRRSDAEPASPIDDLRALLWSCCHPALEAEQRVVCLARAGAGLMPGELADLLGVPEAAIHARLTAAKKVLRAGAARAAVTEDDREPRIALVREAIAAVRAAPGHDASEIADLLTERADRAFVRSI
jgi:RNA polymerase sigma-70 factor (ECF subfamily)